MIYILVFLCSFFITQSAFAQSYFNDCSIVNYSYKRISENIYSNIPFSDYIISHPYDFGDSTFSSKTQSDLTTDLITFYTPNTYIETSNTVVDVYGDYWTYIFFNTSQPYWSVTPYSSTDTTVFNPLYGTKIDYPIFTNSYYKKTSTYTSLFFTETTTTLTKNSESFLTYKTDIFKKINDRIKNELVLDITVSLPTSKLSTFKNLSSLPLTLSSGNVTSTSSPVSHSLFSIYSRNGYSTIQTRAVYNHIYKADSPFFTYTFLTPTNDIVVNCLQVILSSSLSGAFPNWDYSPYNPSEDILNDIKDKFSTSFNEFLLNVKLKISPLSVPDLNSLNSGVSTVEWQYKDNIYTFDFSDYSSFFGALRTVVVLITSAYSLKVLSKSWGSI